MQVNTSIIQEFKTKGYVVLPLQVSRETIRAALTGVKDMRANAIKSQYALTRTYYDHFSNWNIAAIEAPFNESIIDYRIEKLFKDLKLTPVICQIMGWPNMYCSLARLFTMGKYKYRGNWHRDSDITELENPNYCTNVVQVEIYLEKQYGFRYLKKEFDIDGSKSIIENDIVSKSIENYQFPLRPPKNSYEILGGEEGTMLIFNPSRMHQGSTDGERFDFHLRFERLDNHLNNNIRLIKNHFQDFSLSWELGKFTDINSITQSNSLPATELRKKSVGIINSVNYFTAAYNFYRSNKLIKNKGKPPINWEIDYSANTIYQA